MSNPIWLNPNTIDFPPVDLALEEPDALLAVGGDLSPSRIVHAYKNGIFPWFDEEQPILWWSPNPRAVLFPEKILISKSLKKKLKRKPFRITCDQCFSEVVRHCATVPRQGQSGTWITTEMSEAYEALFKQGFGHSIEVWEDDKLVGGLYGLSIGKVFFGESMFSLSTDASKVAFVYLAKQLQRWNFKLIDCQVSNPHLLSMGAEEIDRRLFIDILSKHTEESTNIAWPDHWDDLPLL